MQPSGTVRERPAREDRLQAEVDARDAPDPVDLAEDPVEVGVGELAVDLGQVGRRTGRGRAGGQSARRRPAGARRPPGPPSVGPVVGTGSAAWAVQRGMGEQERDGQGGDSHAHGRTSGSGGVHNDMTLHHPRCCGAFCVITGGA